MIKVFKKQNTLIKNQSNKIYIMLKKFSKKEINDYIFDTFSKSRHYNDGFIHLRTGVVLSRKKLIKHVGYVFKVFYDISENLISECIDELRLTNDYHIDIITSNYEPWLLFSTAWKESGVIDLDKIYNDNEGISRVYSRREFRFQFNFWISENNLMYYQSKETKNFHVEPKINE